MKQKITLIFIVLMMANFLMAQRHATERIIANPLNLSYRFQTEGVCRREAADPVIVLFNGNYYLFASHSSGYWYSENLKDWNYIKTKTLKTVENWAPAVFVYKDAIYHLSMGDKRIYKSTNPEADQWEVVGDAPDKYGDPGIFSG